MIENPNHTKPSRPENAFDDPAKRSRTRNRGRRPELEVAAKSASALVSLVARHPTGSFLVMAFTFLWLSMIPVLFLGWPPPPPTTPLGHLVAAALGACSLALPAFVVTVAVDGKAGVRDLVSRTLRWRVRVRWYLFAVFGVPLGALLLAPLFLGAEPIEALGQNWTLLFTSFLPKLLLALATIQLFEEVAWTGFMQHRVQARHGALRAALLIGPVFALIHLPTYLFGREVTVDGAVAALGTSLAFIPIAIFFRILIAWTYNRTGFSVLLAAVVHASWTSAATVVSPIAGPAAELLAIGTFVLLAIIVAVWSRGTLGYRPSRLKARPLR